MISTIEKYIKILTQKKIDGNERVNKVIDSYIKVFRLAQTSILAHDVLGLNGLETYFKKQGFVEASKLMRQAIMNPQGGINND